MRPTIVERCLVSGGLVWQRNVTESDYREGRVSPLNWQVGKNFYIGELSTVGMTSSASASRSLRLRTLTFKPWMESQPLQRRLLSLFKRVG